MALDQISENTEEKEMTFLDHLEELRWHLVRSVAAIFVFTIAAFLAKSFIWDTVIFGPTKPDFWTYQKLCELAEAVKTPSLCIGKDIPMDLQNREITGQFTQHILSSFIAGLILAFPYAFWEIWRFIKPGLRGSEAKASRGAVVVVSFLFLSGVLFGYFIVTPLSINFLSNYSLSSSIVNLIDIKSLVSLVVTLALACGLMFQLPVVTYFLSKTGLVTPELMKTYRRHSFVVILVVSAVITPPDVISQVLIAFPLVFLYEVSIVISRRIQKQMDEKLA
ncbi:Sec-independent protein translocase TatC [Roseivirga pacifica]|uniref:Sec-independent protein translocase protein TatC n=1 Tax=Roseivirga pacifica TaxID=1267423 RepID=A0A1I0MXH6_9BACT|nr:twin-arginine translocase subunit TatC [Roseivirga pacifica]RKQ50771.1 Sec-independent protein translocase TatC [Roseivirga pacifica]SEV93361.1 Sec-independent protein translocase TatC [Roseivirga pacifica]